MTNNEKKFWDILTNLFVGAEVKGKSGFINLMAAKQSYFKKVQKEILKEIEDVCKDNKDFKDELYDKLYSFFHRYFSQSGSIYYNYTPLFYNIYTKAYSENPSEIKTFSTDYEQVISNKQDTSLFYKTQMLYYVKSDKIFKDLEIEIEGKKYIFDVSNMEGKKANEKKSLVYELKPIEDKYLSFNVIYSEKGRTTKTADIIKEAKKSGVEVKEEDLKKAFQVFEKQSNVDYFINKDAKRFLSEQLDMWIYQYMFSQEVDFDMQRFTQIQDFKKVASELINFISQFENELVKIWNKPRFVLNSNIVVTIDKLKAKGFEIDRLKNHPNFKEQQQEWEELGINQGKGLLENEFLPIDTKYFSELKDEIESLFGEDEFDGLLIKSENYQALNTIQTRFKGKVDLIYIDPPYNTGEDGFIYKDTFKDSTWLSMMNDRLELSNNFLNKKGIFYCSIDDNEMAQLKILSDKVFKQSNFVGNIAWESKTKSQNTKDSYNKLHPKIEYILCYSKTEKPRFNLIKSGEKIYPLIDENGKNYRIQKAEQDSLDRPHAAASMVYSILGVLPSDGKCWKFGIDKKNYWEETNRIFLKDGFPHIVFRPEDESQDINQPFWAFIGKEEGTAETGKKELSHILNHDLNTIKPVNVIKKLIFHATNKEATILDFFAGSATTVEAVLRLNSEDNGKRKFIAIEMGEHFDKIILPRIKKIIFSKDWRNQEAQLNGSLNAVFKYYELEQYEQILRSTKYKDTPNDYLKSKKSDEVKDCFLFDEKLSQVIICENDSFRVDLSKLYENIDLKETIHNLTGKKPKEITESKVIFEDSEYELLEILKPLLVW